VKQLNDEADKKNLFFKKTRLIEEAARQAEQQSPFGQWLGQQVVKHTPGQGIDHYRIDDRTGKYAKKPTTLLGLFGFN